MTYQRHFLRQRHLERRVGKARDRLSTRGPQQRPKNKKRGKRTDVVSVIHRKGDAFALEIIHIHRGWLATTLGRKHELELPRARCQEVRRTILIAERVAADDDGFDPSWDGSGNTLEDDWLAEDGAAEDVADLGT